MRRLVANPPNPYLSAQREWLGEPPAVKLEVYEEHAKSIIAENDSPDVPFRYSLNPYRGCQHACSYCYARPTHEYIGLGAGTDFDSKITVKVNAPELLEKKLAARGLGDEWISFSGVTDCYQPLESVYQLTRRCIEVCIRHKQMIGVVTKSYLVVRDAELLAKLSEVAGVTVYLSIPFADDEMGRAIESGAPPPSRRFEALRVLRQAGVPVGVMVAPLIPGLNDRDVPAILERAAEIGATEAHYVALRLPGSVRDVFLSRLHEKLPLHAARVAARVRDMRCGEMNVSRFGDRMRGEGVYWESVTQLFAKTVARLGMNQRQRDAPKTSEKPTHAVQLPLFSA